MCSVHVKSKITSKSRLISMFVIAE